MVYPSELCHNHLHQKFCDWITIINNFSLHLVLQEIVCLILAYSDICISSERFNLFLNNLYLSLFFWSNPL